MKTAQIVSMVCAIFLMALISCQRENSEIYDAGVSFYPSDTFGLNKAYDYRGIYVNNNELSLPYHLPNSNYPINYFAYSGRLEYNFSGNAIKDFNIIRNDSNVINLILLSKKGNYIALGGDVSDTNNPQDKMMWMDKNFKPLYHRKFADGTRYRGTYGLEELSNGDFAAVTDVFVNGNELKFKLFCIDDSLNIKWQKILPRTPWVSSMVTGQNSILLLFDGYIDQYNYFGKKLKKFTPEKGYTVQKVVGLADGFLMAGKYSRADKIDVIFINKYDNDLKLVKSSFIETKKFSSDPNFVFSFGSNILVADNFYYFITYMSDPDGLDYSKNNTTQSTLVKIDNQLNFIFSKSIVDKRLLSGYFAIYEPTGSLLVRHRDELINIGQAVWNKQIGMSFTRTDLDGNIIK